MAVQHLGEAEARRAIPRADAERADFVRDLFGAARHDLETVDLVVNVGTLTLEDAVETVVDVYRRRFRSAS
jgi:hypothetical protein